MEGVNGTTIILTLGVAIVTALSTLLATFIAQRGQREVKKLEIEGQQEIKAKELVFENYQRRIERYNQILKWSFDKTEDQMQKIAQDNPACTQEQVTNLFSNMFDSIQEPFQDWIEEIEGELTTLDALETNGRHLEFIKQFLSPDTKANIANNLQTFYRDFQKTSSMIYALNEEVLFRKCNALFLKYLPTSNTGIERK